MYKTAYDRVVTSRIPAYLFKVQNLKSKQTKTHALLLFRSEFLNFFAFSSKVPYFLTS